MMHGGYEHPPPESPQPAEPFRINLQGHKAETVNGPENGAIMLPHETSVSLAISTRSEEQVMLSFQNICFTVINRKRMRRGLLSCFKGKNNAVNNFESLSAMEDPENASDVPKSSNMDVNDGDSRVILDNVTGVARSSELTAIIGSSGSGKTTLLDALSLRLPVAPSNSYLNSVGPVGGRTGAIMIDGVPLTHSYIQQHSAYVMQDDLMHAMLTVRETIMFAAEMKLPSSMNHKEKMDRVERILQMLGLQQAADTLIGDENTRGVSGGERKRVAIGCQIVHDPRILFLDEPTSGLDSSNSFRVVKVVKDMAVQCRSIVIMVIHQPSFRVLEQFNQLLLLSKGNRVFYGPPPELPTFMSAFGAPVPQFSNPCEFALELLERLSDIPTGLLELCAFSDQWHADRERQQAAAATGMVTWGGDGADQLDNSGSLTDGGKENCERGGKWGGDKVTHRCGMMFSPSPSEELPKKSSSTEAMLARGGVVEYNGEAVGQSRNRKVKKFANSWFRELCLLTSRGYIMIRRTPSLFSLRIVLVMIAGLMLASLFWRPPHNPQGMMERFAYLSFIAAILFFCSADATPVFIQERGIFIRETSENEYRKSSYVVAAGIMYVPLQLAMAAAITLESWWCVGLTGGVEAMIFFFFTAFLCLFAGNALATFFSALLHNVILAYSVVVSVMAYCLLVSGFYIRRSSIPYVWIWLHYLSPLKYAYEALIINEFNRPESACYLTLNQAVYMQPVSTFLSPKKVLSSLSTFLPRMTKPGVPPLTPRSCLFPGPYIATEYLQVNQMGKWECLLVLFGLALGIRFLYWCVLTLFYSNKRR